MKPKWLQQANIWDAGVILLWASAIAEALLSGFDASPIALALLPAIWTLPLLLRRRWPLQVAVGVMVGLAVESVLAEQGTQVQAALVVAIAAFGMIGWNGPSRSALGAWVVATACAAQIIFSAGGGTGASLAFLAVLSLAPTLAGLLLRTRERETVRIAEHARTLERERDASERAAVAEERARIARELHDMIGHAVSVITVQAGAARVLLDTDDPARAREPLLAIEEIGHQTMAEMRRLIGVLREMGDPGLAPQPDLAQLERLAESVTASGLEVRLHQNGASSEAPSQAIQLAAYRVVQEALTNALKHGDRRPATVSVTRGTGELTVEIESGVPEDAAEHSSGYGLMGMRERVELCGGTLDIGESPARAFTVRAVFPLDERPA